MTVSDTSVPFLDVTQHIDTNGNIDTDLYKKPTDTNQYLLFTSSHPRHTKTAIPYGLAIRICRICSKTDWRDIRLAELKISLIERGYPENLVSDQINRAKIIPRDSLLQYKTKTVHQRIPLVSTYNPHHPDIKQITNNHLKILHKSNRCLNAIPVSPMLAHRRCNNLRDLLVHSEIKQCILPSGFHKCESTRGCNICKFSENSSQFYSHSTTTKYTIRQHITCTSKNIIYLITCKRCQKQYVGETKTQFRLRFNNHLSTIRRKTNTPVAIHFNENQHTIEDLTITGIIKLNKSDDILRRKLESVWISKLNTLTPNGLNILS